MGKLQMPDQRKQQKKIKFKSFNLKKKELTWKKNLFIQGNTIYNKIILDAFNMNKS